MVVGWGKQRLLKQRAPIGRGAILDAGMVIAGRPGTKAVRFRDIAVELGMDAETVGKQFRDQDDLTAALFDRVVLIIIERVTVDPANWREYLTTGAEKCLEVFLGYPCLGAEAAAGRTVGPAELGMMESLLDALRTAGLNDAEMLRFYAAYSSFTFAFCATAARDRLAPRTQASMPGWVQPAAMISPDEHPNVTALWPRLIALDYRSTFLNALSVICDGIEAAAAAARAPVESPRPA